jgi:hypothetical protein
MGKEATCQCQWAGESGQCKVLLETHELTLRGAGKVGRRTVSIASLTGVRVEGDLLRFRAGEDEVALTLGAAQAQSWAKKITTPPPTLAAKLGITPATHLKLLGEFETDELKTAITQAASTDSKGPNLILANIKTVADLNYALDSYKTYPSNPPIWVIYPKGPNKPLSESQIRTTLRHEGFIDTKVASVSATLTALRFIKRS